MDDSEVPINQEPTPNTNNTPLSHPNEPVSEGNTAPPPATAEPTIVKKPTKKSSTWLILIIVVVIIVVGLGIWYAVAHKSSTNTTTVKKDIPLITYGFNNNPLNLFYPSQAAWLSGTNTIDEQMFEGLVAFNKGTQIVPELAAGWTNPNTTTWIFTLKQNIYYHDGDTVTAQDVIYSWQQLNTQNQDLASYTTSTIKSIQALNNNTVEITTTAPDPVLLNRLTGLFILDSKAPSGTQPWELGTGPYTVKPSTTPTANSLDLVAFNNWHGGHIYTKAIDYVFYSDPAKATAALNAGKVDVVDDISTTDAATIKSSNLKVFTPPSLTVDFIGFYTLNPSSPIANAKVREAIDLTINPATVLKVYNVPGTTIDQVIPSQVPGYNQSITPPTINLTEAKQLLTAAGYPNGFTLNFGIGEPAQAAGQEIATELKQIGITTNLEVATSEGTYFADIDNGTYQASYEGYSTNITDGSDILAYWQNASFYNNTTFDSQLAQANTIFNPTQRLTVLQQAEQTLLNDYAYVPLFQHSYLFASNKNITFPLGCYDGDLDTMFANVYQN
jgi:peptide/nickel transport system substrate-binding protein